VSEREAPIESLRLPDLRYSEPPPVDPDMHAATAAEPTPLQSFWASFVAVLNKEARWRMRGRRAFVVVSIYAGLLALLVLAVLVLIERTAAGFSPDGEPIPGGLVPGSMAATVGQAIFTTILFVQTLLTVLFVPALTSGSVSIEREKQTLELLVTTPISTLGLVVGKLISSLAYVFLLILASMPLMSVVFTFGGVAPEDVVRAYVVLFAAAFGMGAIGVFLSALLRRSGVSTALAYLIVFALVFGSLVAHTYLTISATVERLGLDERVRPPPEALLWLSPIVADIDLMCTGFPESGACHYIGFITDTEVDPTAPPRDAYWPRSALAFVVVGSALTLATTQLIAPTRRWRSRRRADWPRGGDVDRDPATGTVP
jgi:ABC-type transport system involved in multi-copper enzyme maturation permease subunit